MRNIQKELENFKWYDMMRGPWLVHEHDFLEYAFASVGPQKAAWDTHGMASGNPFGVSVRDIFPLFLCYILLSFRMMTKPTSSDGKGVSEKRVTTKAAFMLINRSLAGGFHCCQAKASAGKRYELAKFGKIPSFKDYKKFKKNRNRFLHSRSSICLVVYVMSTI
ncbi:hypothetical protein LZ30DRAFT_331375 [Colletotrichum cereale]|nr:hypothetical protein LZ30DRAFT_331375 [Colletotrichum cereale]